MRTVHPGGVSVTVLAEFVSGAGGARNSWCRYDHGITATMQQGSSTGVPAQELPRISAVTHGDGSLCARLIAGKLAPVGAGCRGLDV